MINPITNYFTQEKKESVFFIGLGIVACIVAMYHLFVTHKPYYNGVAYAFLALGAVQLVVGVTIYLRCDMDTVRVHHYFERERKSIADYEIPRMEEVMKNFVIYRWVELGLILVGMILLFIGEKRTMLKGLGLGLLVQSVLMLFLDYFAERRGRAYLTYLRSVDSSDAVIP